MAEAEKPDEQQTFTSRKLDLLDAISMDPRVSDGEFRVAFRLLQHANSKTGAIFPSQDRVASQIGTRERTVRRHVAGLVRKGWLAKARRNKQLPNFYTFSDAHVNAILDRQATMEESRKDERRNRLIGQNCPISDDLTGQNLPVPAGQNCPIPAGQNWPVNTSSYPLKGTPDSKGLNEGSGPDGKSRKAATAIKQAAAARRAIPKKRARTAEDEIDHRLRSHGENMYAWLIEHITADLWIEAVEAEEQHHGDGTRVIGLALRDKINASRFAGLA